MNTLGDKPWYIDHMAPVRDIVPDDPDTVLVASWPDVTRAQREGYRRIVLMQHGIGQSYSNQNPHYPGGAMNDAVDLFLVPGRHPEERWRKAYPDARVEVVGSPRLDFLPARQPGPPTVAVSFHWNGYAVPESRSALGWFRHELPALAERYHVIGHGHPRWTRAPMIYADMGIEYVPDFADVCRQADVYVCDNSSTIYEFASTGRPVVVLDAPIYRHDVHHGLRFWDAADVGIRVREPAFLHLAVDLALEDGPYLEEQREAALDVVYAYRHGAAQRAAEAIAA